jgi:hypothetical protein
VVFADSVAAEGRLRMTAIMHGNRATRHALKRCNISGECDLRHARVGVQHNDSYLAPLPCKVTCTVLVQHRSTYLRNTEPVMHYVQDGRSIYRNSSTTTVDLPDHRRNHQTARAKGQKR